MFIIPIFSFLFSFLILFFSQAYLLGRTACVSSIRISRIQPWRSVRAAAIRVSAPSWPGEPATQHPDGAVPPRTCAPPALIVAALASLSASAPPAPLTVRPRRHPFLRRPAPPPTVPARGGHQCEVKPVGASILAPLLLSSLVST